MLITDDFVLINFPKTGSSFARKAIYKAYQARLRGTAPLQRLAIRLRLQRKPLMETLMLPNSEYRALGDHTVDQHGRVEQIPPAHRHKPVLSIARNPFERAVSGYEYRWWTDHLLEPLEAITDRYPRFPDLNFGEYLDFMDSQARFRTSCDLAGKDIGIQTIEFVQYYFFDPESALQRLNDDYIDSGRYLEDMPKITFLKTSSLRQRKAYWSAELIAGRRRKERLLLRMYADRGLHFALPTAPG